MTTLSKQSTYGWPVSGISASVFSPALLQTTDSRLEVCHRCPHLLYMLSVRPAALASSPVLAISAVPAPRTAICALSTLVPTLSCQGLVLCSHQVQKISQSIFIHSFFLPKRWRSKQKSVAELVELKLFGGAGAVISYFGSTALVTGYSWKKIIVSDELTIITYIKQWCGAAIFRGAPAAFFLESNEEKPCSRLKQWIC